GLEILTDADIADFIEGKYLPDILAIKKGRGECDYEIAKFWIEIKEVRRDQRWLLIPASSARERPYDAYVAVWVGLPDDHIAWLIKNVPEVAKRMTGSDWEKKFNELEKTIESIPCRVIGFVLWDDVKNVLTVRQKSEIKNSLNQKYGERRWYYFSKNSPLFDPEDPRWKGSKVRNENVGFYLKSIANASKNGWNELVEKIKANSRIVEGAVPIKKGEIPKVCKELAQKSYKDFRDLFLSCIEKQFNEIQRRYGCIRRVKSWFQQPLR
ncbi:MAG: hypothetical protein QW680_12575, partial [Pyrobaculum sp.]